MGTDHEHRICTFQEAEEAIRAHEVIYLNDCFCRRPTQEGKTPWEYCGHPIDTCMGFQRMESEVPYPITEISREEALQRFEDWKKQGNFFRFMAGDKWVCFCCACGCGWFRDENGAKKTDPCGKSAFIEKTDAKACTQCGTCVEVCAFGARQIEDEEMLVDAEQCYGCSACEYACPEDAVALIPRPA
ncbi:MAG: ATP-binding protein [Planctomycetota bacterium]|jgi:ferredoxin